VLLAAVLALAAVFADEPARFLVVEDGPHRADAALVLAGDPDYERTRSAAQLYLAGEVRLLILTGGERWGGDNVDRLREVALGLGVPANAIRSEHLSHSTREAIVAIMPIVEREGVRSLAVVTSPYHQRRALLTARRYLAGVSIVSRPASASPWRPEGWWKSTWNRNIVIGEYTRIAYYLVRGWI
jgi:uncharacterized SAM-binding protein YcdF (DUF218 family)